ncbi:hypothetical protein VTI28DRAFT_3197 [Corynascus sepedonium]
MKERERLPASSHFVLGEAFYTTEYHAELQVFNYFNAMHMAFQDYDRYINCSKSAYWFCFQYLKNLRSTFTRPGVEDTFAEPSCYNEVLPGVSFLPSRHNSIVEDMKAKLNDVVLNTIHEALLDNCSSDVLSSELYGASVSKSHSIVVSHGDALGPSPSIGVPEPGEEWALKSERKKKD